MGNNGNGYRNGSNYHRCNIGILLKEWDGLYCLMCGWRISFYFKENEHEAYLTEAIIARLILDDCNEIDDLMNRDFKLAGLAK